MRIRPLLFPILALSASLAACATPQGRRTVERPTQDRSLVSTHYELVPSERPIASSPLELTFERVERYRTVHAGEKAVVETVSHYSPYRELWEVPLGAFMTVTGVAFFWLEEGRAWVPIGLRMANPAQNIGSGSVEERDVEVTPLPERIEEQIVRTPLPDARVRLSLAGLPARELRSDADGRVRVFLPYLVTRAFRGLPNRVRARASHPEAGKQPVDVEVEVERELALRLAAAAPAALVVGAESAPLGKLADGVFTLKRLGFAGYADAHHERALSHATGAPACRLGEGSRGWVYASGGCRDGLAEGPGEAYTAAGDRRLRGEFRAGQLVRGRDEHVSGRAFSGDWRRFQLHGPGSHHEGAVLQYEGGYANGERHGEGTCRFEGRYERCEHRAGERVDQVFVMRDELRRSRAELAKMQAEQKRMLEAQAEEARRVAAEREALARQQAEAERRRQQAAQQSSSGPDFGQMLAFGLGAAALGTADVPVDIKTEATAALAQDILGGANGAATQRLRQKYASPPAAPSSAGASASSSASDSGGDGYQSDSIQVSCRPDPIEIKYKTAQCRSAMAAFTQAFVCNEITTPEKQRAVESRCMQACGSRQCLQ